MAMASLLVLILTATISTTSVIEATRQFKVGDDLGWRQPDPQNSDFYTQWAETNRFRIGDSLEFEYQNDSVVTVEKWDYYHCDASDPITAFDNGRSVINLDRSGPFYFISGTFDHCINGQRLIVEVMSPHPIPVASPPSISPDDAAPPQYQVGPSPSSSSPPINSASEPSEVSSSVVLRSDFMAVLVVFVVMLLYYLTSSNFDSDLFRV